MYYQKDYSGIIALSVIVGLILLAVFGRACMGSDLTYSRHVSGKITSTGSRYVRGSESGQDKIALQLNPFASDPTVKRISGGSDGLAVECVSTRCAALEKGQCVELVCAHEVRWLEPDVVGCKMERTVACQ